MTKHVPDINKQSLKFPGEWHKNIHSVLNNVLLDNNIKSYTVLFRFSDMYPQIGGGGGTCTLKWKKIYVLAGHSRFLERIMSYHVE
jgi:hypothetical protein